MSNTPEPPPKPINRPASWPQVIEFLQAHFTETPERLALEAAMTERHAIGTQKYGVPLTAGNGRKHLVDAYQEALDLAVYLRTELEERGFDPLKGPENIFAQVSPEVQAIAMMLAGAVQSALLLQTIVDGGDLTKA